MARRLDLLDRAAARTFVDDVVMEYGRLDILVNNSGVTWPRPFLEMDDELWDQTFGINLHGMYVCTQQAAKHMVRLGSQGRIVNISSVHAFSSMPNHVHYESTKGGITMFTKATAIDLAPYHIRVNAIAPGAIEVERSRANPNYEGTGGRKEMLSKRIPIGRVGQPADIAGALLFLVSDLASYVT